MVSERLPGSLVSTDWLAAHLGNPDVRVVDIRGSVTTEDLGGGRQRATYAGAPERYAEGHIPGSVFVDNYVSMVGTSYHTQPGLSAVVDVLLAPPYGVWSYRERHLYPMEFYAQTAELPFGLGWSPLIAGRPPPRGCFQQEYGVLALRRGCPGLP